MVLVDEETTVFRNQSVMRKTVTQVSGWSGLKQSRLSDTQAAEYSESIIDSFCQHIYGLENTGQP